MIESLSIAAPVLPPVTGGLSESVRRLCTLSDAELAMCDTAELNLLVACGLPGAEDLDIGASLHKLNTWANLVRLNTMHWWPAFVRSPEKYERSSGKFRMMALVTVLQRYLEVRYHLPFSEGEFDGTDSRNLFLHGLLSGHGGTCVTMPILYAAIGRRLGYPLKLVQAKEHFFLRWEELDGERFNVECTSPGFVSHDDVYYRRYPKPLTDEELALGFYLHSLSPREELASFLGERGTCLVDHLQTYAALEAFYYADGLFPDSPCLRGAWVTATMLWSMIERSCRGLSCTHDEFVAVARLRAYKNELSYDDLPFSEPKDDVERWAVSNAREFLQRILRNSVRKWRQADAHRRTFVAIGAANDNGHTQTTFLKEF